jgi:transposase
MQINKSDRNDAAGIARIMQTGWFKEVRVKNLDSHAVKALLARRPRFGRDQVNSGHNSDIAEVERFTRVGL